MKLSKLTYQIKISFVAFVVACAVCFAAAAVPAAVPNTAWAAEDLTSTSQLCGGGVIFNA